MTIVDKIMFGSMLMASLFLIIGILTLLWDLFINN